MNRQACKQWCATRGYPVPPKSSCKFCPYRRNSQWRAMRDGEPAEWAEVLAIDAWLREPAQITRFHGVLFVHSDRVPLAEADLEDEAPGQLNLFSEECEGMCGV